MNVLITGGSRGIGKAIAEELCSTGHDVLIVSQNESNVKKTVQELENQFNTTVLGKAVNVGEEQEIEALYDYCQAQNFSPNVLVLNAGVFIPGTLADSKTEDFQKIMDINFFHVYHCVHKFINVLRGQDNAKIFVISSVSGLETYVAGLEYYPMAALYNVSKWALRGYVLNLRKELVKDDIGVTLINPGATLTDIWAGNEIAEDRFLESTDISKLISACLTLSSRAVVEEINIRPMLGDIK